MTERERDFPMDIEFDCGDLTLTLEENRRIFYQDKGSEIQLSNFETSEIIHTLA